MKYGDDLVKDLEKRIWSAKKSISDRLDHIYNCDFDWTDCGLSMRADERTIGVCNDEIRLIRDDGGYGWFREYATLDGDLIPAKWVETRYGYKLRAKMPDGSVIWTGATTKKGLAKKGLKKVLCRRPAWYELKASGSGRYGAYTARYELVPSDVNYATGDPARKDPIEIRDLSDE